MHTYGDLPTGPIHTKITVTADTGNGTSSFNRSAILTQEITCQWADIDSVTPALYSACTVSGYEQLILTNADADEQPLGLAKVTLTYTAAATSTPATSYAEQTSQVEVDIQLNPNFSDWAADWDSDAEAFKPGTSKFGISRYIKGSTTVTKTEWFTSQPSHRMASVGKLQVPGGDYSESNHYLIIGANRSLQGKFWQVVTTYLYSPDEYNTDVYPAA